MGLQSAFDLVLNMEEPLAAIDELIWQSLDAGAKSKKHPWNLGSFTTIEMVEGKPIRPMSRTVVLRRANRGDRSVDLFTDSRSDKVDHLESFDSSSSVCWLFYEASTKIQLRLQGRAEVISGEEANRQWRDMTVEGRSNYLSITRPGTLVNATSPPDTSDRFVSEEESERGRDHFRIVRTFVDSSDWLYLRRAGHVRVRIHYDESGAAQADWIVP